jgi:hypothetical protein
MVTEQTAGNFVGNRIKLNVGPGEIEWKPSTKEAEAAWAIYVEPETRVAGFLER